LGKSLAAALLLALPLAGCVQAPSTAPSQSEIAPGALGLGDVPAPQLQSDWWKEFHDPQLDRLVDQMLAKNPTLQGALARIRAAEAEVSAARSLQYPSIAIDGTDTLQLVSKEFVYPQRFGGTWQWVGDVQARLRWSLDFWGKQAALIDRARNVRQAASLDAGAARLALAGQFAQSYVALLLAWQNIDIAHQTLDERQVILDLTQSRVTSGLENEASLEQAKALLAMSRMELRRAEAQRDIGVHAIAALIGRGADAYPSITRPAAAVENALPLPEHLREGLDSPLADLQNIAGDPGGGMLVAGHYLAEFVSDGVSWAHLDIAGPSFNDGKPYGYTTSGGTVPRVMLFQSKRFCAGTPPWLGPIGAGGRTGTSLSLMRRLSDCEPYCCWRR